MSAGLWHVSTVVETRDLTPTGRSIVLDVDGWRGNEAGQHVDVRLTAEDGYQAVRSYSMATSGPAERVELVVDRLPDGEVSTYLVDELRVGDQVELRGPLGGYFIWRPELTDPVQLIAGGSGIVPLVSMLRAHRDAWSTAQFRLLYSVRSPEDVYFRSELDALGPDVELTYNFTRLTPDGWPLEAGRLDEARIAASVLPASADPLTFVCGPTGFVERVAETLVDLGHDALRVRTERFGGL